MFSLSLSYFQKKFILESTLNIQCFSFCNLIRNWRTYANEGENVNKYPPVAHVGDLRNGPCENTLVGYFNIEVADKMKGCQSV